jgi:hypothetical protein
MRRLGLCFLLWLPINLSKQATNTVIIQSKTGDMPILKTGESIRIK